MFQIVGMSEGRRLFISLFIIYFSEARCPARLILLDLVALTIFNEGQVTKRLVV
jgi:hypothetical protein